MKELFDYFLKYKSMIDWDKIEDLGQTPDVDIAKRLEVSPQAVFQARKRRDIPAVNPTNRCEIDWDSVPLGQMTDEHLADILGCSGAYICKKRKARNIPPFGIRYRTLENEAAYYEEAIIDLWLHNQEIDHKFQFQIGPYRVDWLICNQNQVWEFLGMWDHGIYGQQYRKNFETKKRHIIELGYDIREIHRSEIDEFKQQVDLTKIHTDGIFQCKGCGRKNIKHQAKGLCGMCITRSYQGKKLGKPKITFLKPEEQFICEDCGSDNRHKRVKKKCHCCYMKQYKKNKHG